MICKNCMHKNVCENVILRMSADVDGSCKQFEDENLLIKLPVPVGTDVYYIDWDYNDDDFGDQKVWFIEKIPFAARMIDTWGIDIFASEKEAKIGIENWEKNYG